MVAADGVIVFLPLLQSLADVGSEGGVVVVAEQDPAKTNPLDYARKARAYLREVERF